MFECFCLACTYFFFLIWVKVRLMKLLFFSSRQKLEPFMTATCLTAPPTLSTSMTRPRLRRRTWISRHPICSTTLKDRLAFNNSFLLLSSCGKLMSVWFLFGVRYSNSWRWTATGVLCTHLCIGAALSCCSQSELGPWTTWRVEVLLQVTR